MPHFPLLLLWYFTTTWKHLGQMESPGWGLLEAGKVLARFGPDQKRTLAVLIKLKTAESNSLLI